VPCPPWLKAQVAEAVSAEGYPVFELPSGAGHDGMAMVDADAEGPVAADRKLPAEKLAGDSEPGPLL
jgi:hypothetical protein